MVNSIMTGKASDELAPSYKMRLEKQSQERMAELLAINQKLEGEIQRCRKAEARLRNKNRKLATVNTIATALNKQLLEQARLGQEQILLLSRRLVEVQETERRHLAHELHDEFGQLLTGLKFTLKAIERRQGEETAYPLAEAYRILEDLIARVRKMSLELRPPILDHLGLVPALSQFFQRYTEQTNIAVHFKQFRMARRFDPQLEITIFRIVQEALTNVARHSGADVVSVRLWIRAQSLFVQVSDAGAGFCPEVALASGHSVGLIGMRERAGLLGGTFSVQSAPDRGTVIKVKLPLGSR